MPDLLWLADLGRASVAALWLPVAAWSAVALVAEAALRLGRAPAALALPTRGAVLAALPLAVLVPPTLAALAPEAAIVVAAAVPDVTWLPEVAVGGPAPVAEATGPPLLDMLLGLGVLGIGLVGAYRVVELLHALVSVARVRRAFSPSGPDGQAAVDTARRRLGVARAVEAAEAPAGAAPFTVGWRRPVVALPTHLDADAREVAAVHEVAHVRRDDFAWHAAQRAVAAVFGAHPLVWTLGRGLDLDRERAADALVLDACPDKRRTYADLLFSYAALPAPALALGAARGSSSLKSRIDAMTTPVSPTQSRRLGRLGRVVGLAVLALVGGLAMTTAPTAPTASTVTTDDAPAVERLVVRMADGEPNALELTLPDGATRADAEAVMSYVEANESDAVRLLVVVFYGADALSREVSISRGQTTFRDGLSFSIYGDARPIGPAQRMLRARADTTDEVYEIADDQPVLIGGLEGIQERLEYPELQRRAGVEGRAVLQFIVETDGTVGDLEVIRSSGNDGLDQAALAAVRPSRFEPGRVDGEPVRVRFALPVTFRLPEGEAGARFEPGPRPEVGEPAADGTYEVADEQPQLIGGLEGLQSRVEYPPLARGAGIEGQVIVQFVVNESGAVQDAVVLRSPDDILSEAALRAVRGSRFEPGRVDGAPVKVRFAVPVTFRLPNGDGVDRGERFPGTRLTIDGLDVASLEDPAMMLRFLTLYGQLLRHHAPDLEDGARAQVRTRLDAEGRPVPRTMSVTTENEAFRDLAAFLLVPVDLPERAGETLQFTVNYVRPD
jgi:TonB family protein